MISYDIDHMHNAQHSIMTHLHFKYATRDNFCYTQTTTLYKSYCLTCGLCTESNIDQDDVAQR